MPMKIGLTGPSGCGKTSLCQKVNDELGIPYRYRSVRSFMPEGISSHPDVLAMAANEPEKGIKFQADQIKDRKRYFADLAKQNQGFITDRTSLDSLVYYLMHNSPFDWDANSQNLVEITKQNLNTFDVVIVLDNSQFKEIEENGVRVTNRYYHTAYHYLTEKVIKSMLFPNRKPYYRAISKKLFDCYRVGNVEFLLNSVNTLEDRFKFIRRIMHTFHR